MPLTKAESGLKAQNAARLETRAKSIGVSSALLVALENSRPTTSLPQNILFRVSESSQIVYKSLSSLVKPRLSSSSWKTHDNGVPTGLFRLPLEIREQIYGLVTGHKTVLEIPENYHKHRPTRKTSNNGSTSLLQTCRQIYAEAVAIVYTQNTFHFVNHNDFLAFAHVVNPVSLGRITSLKFDLNSLLRVDSDPYDFQCPRFAVGWVDDAPPQWSHTWSIIAAMDNLMELKVFLEDPGSPEWDGMECICVPESEILIPLLKVQRRLKTFEVNVPWVNGSYWGPSLELFKSEGALFNLTLRGTTVEMIRAAKNRE